MDLIPTSVVDHVVAICRTEEMKIDGTRDPLLFHRSAFCALREDSPAVPDARPATA